VTLSFPFEDATVVIAVVVVAEKPTREYSELSELPTALLKKIDVPSAPAPHPEKMDGCKHMLQLLAQRY